MMTQRDYRKALAELEQDLQDLFTQNTEIEGLKGMLTDRLMNLERSRKASFEIEIDKTFVKIEALEMRQEKITDRISNTELAMSTLEDELSDEIYRTERIETDDYWSVGGL